MEILIYDEIMPPLAETIAKQLRAKPRDPVAVRINSYGGSASEAVAIYNALQAHGGKVTVTVEGMAYSSATIIACSGRCIAYESAVFGFHAPWSQVAGPASELRDAAQSLDKVSEAVAWIYVTKTGKPIDEMRQLLTGRIGTWLSAAEAKDAGFVDEVIGKSTQLCIGNLVLPERFKMSVENPAEMTKPPVHMTANAIVSMCVDEPGLVSHLLSKPRTQAEVQAKLDDARLIRQMAKVAHFAPRDPRIDSMVFAGVSPDVAGPQIWRLLAEIDASLPVDNVHTGRVSGPVAFGGYGGHHFLSAASDALAIRMGAKPKETHPAARDLEGAGLLGLAQMCVAGAGHQTIGLSRSKLAQMAMSTSDFPELLSASANKALSNRFEAAVIDHRQFCETASLPDFKPASAVNVSFLPGLQKKLEGGEIKYGALTDGAESYSLATFARGLALSREALINDDLSAFAAVIASAANAGARLERDLVFAILTGNPAMSDGNTLFHANHGNLDTGSVTIDAAGLSVARVLMRKQQDSNGGYVMTSPRFIVCPVGLESTAEALVASLTYRPATNTEVETPDWIRGLTIVSDPRLDAANTGDWYLLSEPTIAPVIRLAYLNNQTSPVVEQAADFDRDITKFKVRFDVACTAVGWAGAVKLS